jgi:Fic family protein
VGNIFLQGIAEQAVDATNRTKRLLDLREKWREQLTDAHSSTFALRLVDSLFRMPIVTTPGVRDLLGVSFVTAQNNVDKLLKAGILEEVGKIGRSKTFCAMPIIKILREP